MDKLVKMKGMFPYGAKQSETRNKRVSKFTNPGILKEPLTKVLL